LSPPYTILASHPIFPIVDLSEARHFFCWHIRSGTFAQVHALSAYCRPKGQLQQPLKIIFAKQSHKRSQFHAVRRARITASLIISVGHSAFLMARYAIYRLVRHR
ncbi:hypothetical protein, partial [Methylobacterium thuringiense]|uniref:hypothetical protein n=1 Tax=Methylobacterium thuringiense TaxID=1003091 RepID=UPI001EDCB9E0